jgi:hypothetical protein
MSDELEFNKTIELREPIENDGHKLTALTLRPPKTGERRQAEGHLRQSQTPQNYTSFAIALVAKCANVKEAVVEAMYDDQFTEAWNWVADFLSRGQITGNK